MRYTVCISFESTHRKYAHHLAAAFRREKLRVFFDEDETPRLWGMPISATLDKVYSDDSYFCVVLLSDLYHAKMYPRIERHAMLRRRQLGQHDYILPILMDGSALPDDFKDIAFLRPADPNVIAKEVHRKAELHRERAEEGVLLEMGRGEYRKAIAIAKKYLRRLDYRFGRPFNASFGAVVGFCLYNIACCYSRLAQGAHPKYRKVLFDLAIRYIGEWLSEQSVRAAYPSHRSAINAVNQDDDLLEMRREKRTVLKAMFNGVAQRSGDTTEYEVNVGAVGGSGCIEAQTHVATAKGLLRAEEVRVGHYLQAYDPTTHERSLLRVVSVRKGTVCQIIRINTGVDVSEGQRLFEQAHGWIPAASIILGMHLLTSTGFAEVKSVSVIRTPAIVYEYSLEGAPHSFLANQYVCHNMKA